MQQWPSQPEWAAQKKLQNAAAAHLPPSASPSLSRGAVAAVAAAALLSPLLFLARSKLIKMHLFK